MAESSNLQQSPAQDETVALPTSLLPADTSEISGNPLESSPWTTAGSSNNGPSRQQQASSPLSESTKSVLFSSNSIANCANNSPNHIQPPSRRKRSQLSKRQKEDSCPSQQLLQIEPGTDHKALPPSGSDERKGPWPAFEDGGEDIEKRILLLMLTQGVDGVPDSNACWQDTYMQIPVCAPLLGSKQSPAQVVEPCRLWRINDLCDMLEDMWCCTIAKEQIQDEEGLYLPNPTFGQRYRTTGLICIMVNDPYGNRN